MSLSRLAPSALALALLLSATRASADEPRTATSVELLTGYGLELVTVGSNGPSAYGLGLGMRAGLTLPARFYLGGTFIHHLGWEQEADDAGRSSTYRGAYHTTYAGAELGWSYERSALLLRGYVGAGALVAFGRTVVGRVERADDQGFFYVAPGLLTAARIRRWYGGFDTRFVMVPVLQTSQWAPALLFVVGTSR